MGQGFDGNTSRMSVPVNDETEGKAIRPRSGRFRVSDPGPAGVAARGASPPPGAGVTGSCRLLLRPAAGARRAGAGTQFAAGLFAAGPGRPTPQPSATNPPTEHANSCKGGAGQARRPTPNWERNAAQLTDRPHLVAGHEHVAHALDGVTRHGAPPERLARANAAATAPE